MVTAVAVAQLIRAVQVQAQQVVLVAMVMFQPFLVSLLLTQVVEVVDLFQAAQVVLAVQEAVRLVLQT